MKKGFWYGEWEYYHLGSSKPKIVLINSLADEGEKLLLESFFRGENTPTAFYLGLCNSILDDAKTLATIVGEMSGSGYGRAEIARSSVGWPLIDQDAGDWRVTSTMGVFTATGGNIGPFKSLFLANVGSGTSGRLIAYAAFPEDQVILSGDSGGVKMRIKLK